MKKLFALICLFIIVVGCQKEATLSKSDKKEIVLDRQVASVGWLNHYSPIDSILILDGNGGYRVIFPKYLDGEAQEKVSYSSNYLEVWIKNNEKIMIKRSKADNSYLGGFFCITDSKGAKRVIYVKTAGWLGLVVFGSTEEEKLLSDDDYWLL